MTVDTKDLDEDQRADRLTAAERTVARMVTEVVERHDRPPTVTYDVVEGDPSIVLVDASRVADLIVLAAMACRPSATRRWAR
jgi:nucleotide-binding universal stress UspA family protein